MFNLIRPLALVIQNLFNGFDSAVKNAEDGLPIKDRPIFIIGAPRTGSTCFFQILVSQFRLAYVSNIMALLPRFMVTMCYWYPKVAYGYKNTTQFSKYGYISGLFSPNEAGKIFHKWFDQSDSQEQLYVQQTIALISSMTQCPVVAKNLSNTIRLTKIQKILPESQFVFLRRNPIFTAQSILLARRNLYGNDHQWFGVKPPGYEKILSQDPFYQVVWQTMSLEKLAQTHCSSNPMTCFTIYYEDFCQSPQKILHSMETHFQLNKRIDAPEISKSLSNSNTVKLPDREWQKLEQVFHQFSDNEGLNSIE